MPAQIKSKSNLACQYARRSSSGQNELSEIGQLYGGDKHLADNGLGGAGQFEDVGSGLSTDHRPGLFRMIDKTMDPDNDIGHIMLLDLSKYSRSKVDPHIFLAMLGEAGITVHNLRDGKRSDTEDISSDIYRNLQFVPEQPRDGEQKARHRVPCETGGLLRCVAEQAAEPGRAQL